MAIIDVEIIQEERESLRPHGGIIRGSDMEYFWQGNFSLQTQ